MMNLKPVEKEKKIPDAAAKITQRYYLQSFANFAFAKHKLI